MKEIMDTRKFKMGSVWVMERDIEILEMLFQYRALLPEQLANYYGISVEVMRKRMNKLCKIELVKKVQLKRYRVNQSRQGVVYFITILGIRILRENETSVAKFNEKVNQFTPSNLRVEANHLPFILNANDMGLELQNYDWEYIDSREAKELYSLNRQLLLHGLFRDVKGREMWYYGYQDNLLEKTVRMVASELEVTSVIQNVLITTKGEKATRLLHELSNPVNFTDKKIYTTSNVMSLKILDLEFAKLYFSCFTDDESVFEFVSTIYPRWINFKKDWVSRKAMPFLNTVADLHEYDENRQLKGTQQVYVVNMLDVDLVKIKEIQRYTEEERQREGLNVLLLVTEKDKPIISEYFSGRAYQHFLYFVIPTTHIERYRDEYYE